MLCVGFQAFRLMCLTADGQARSSVSVTDKLLATLVDPTADQWPVSSLFRAPLLHSVY